RPQALNALDTELTAALEGAVERVAAMTDVTVLVIAGRGRAFCAGNDITEMATLSAEQAEALARRQAALMARFATLPQVTLAAIEALRLGLVNRVVAAPTLEATAAAWAADVARSPRGGLEATKAIVAELRRPGRGAEPEAYGAALRTSPEARARIQAFVDRKRG